MATVPRNHRKGYKRIAVTLLLLLFGGYSAYSFFLGNKAAVPAVAVAPPVATDIVGKSAPAKLTPEELQRQEQMALGRSRLKSVLDGGQAIRTSCDALDQELKHWESDVQSLWTNDIGRLVASDSGAMLEFETQTKAPRPTLSDADALRNRLVTLLTPVQAAWDAEQWSYHPTNDLVSALKQLKTDMDAALDQARQPRTRIDMLVTSAKVRAKPADTTLQAALDEYHSRQATQWAESESAARRKVDQELGDKRTAQAAQAERDKQQATLELERAQQNLEKTKLTTATEKASTEAEHDQLVQKANSQATHRLLSFFMTPGYLQPNGQSTVEKRPYSFKLLEADGCLEPTLDGQTRLFGHMTDWRDRDRPLVQNNNLNLSNQPNEVRERVNQLQKALIELGPTLVELKLLDP